MTDHFVRHMLRPGDYIATEFKCEAPVGSWCRVSCSRCWSEKQCICASLEREPDMQDQGECMAIWWLKDGGEECYNGEEQQIRGPGWQEIVTEWQGDYMEWDYA